MPTGAGSLNGAPGDAAAWPGVMRPLDAGPAPPQFTPAEVPGCPAAKTTLADGSSRQAPIVREANACFISALPFKFKTILQVGRIGQCPNARVDHRRPGGEAERGLCNPRLLQMFRPIPTF